MTKNQFSRRDFFKTSALASTAIISGAGIASAACSGNTENNSGEFFHSESFVQKDGIAGLLFSQIGYELNYPIRIIVRLPEKDMLKPDAICKLVPGKKQTSFKTSCIYWGELWGSHWWVADFQGITDPGEWNVEVYNGDNCVFRDKGLKIGKNILWDQTLELASVDMLERRLHFTKVGAGWQDAGTLWVESPAQSAMVIALNDILETGSERLDKSIKERIYRQITVGCDYLVMTQVKAAELGFPKGSFSHDLLGHEKDILPNDAVKAVIALAGAARLLPGSYSGKKAVYQETATLAWQWLCTTAKPLGDLGLSRFQRGLPEDVTIPGDEWQTRDLVSLCWASLEQWKNQVPYSKENAVNYANEIMKRQIRSENAENGFYGHFLEYPSMTHSEKSWIHGIVNNSFGADIGGIYPNYLVPLVEMLKVWSDHEDAPAWKETLEQFAYGYLIPSCEKNPFLLVPQGIFGEEGPVWFCGTFHGTNAIYGYTAALALELSTLFDEPKLKSIAYGNLQWLAGLNGGITRENLKACVIFSTDVPERMALPASMMCGVGNRWAGTWFQTRGVICNGFSTGKQFVYDTEPKKINDGPFSLTDEDWIPHSAAWLSGLVRI